MIELAGLMTPSPFTVSRLDMAVTTSDLVVGVLSSLDLVHQLVGG